MVERIVGIFISVVVGSSVIFMDNLPGTDYQERETVIVMETEPQVTEYDKVLFAQIVMAEAGDQGLYGKRLVVDVILNRIDSEHYPCTLEGVISQTGQFTAYENGAVWRVDPDEECYQAIEMELANRTDSEIIYFRTDHYSEYGIPCYQYGDHYFSRKE